MPLSLLDDIAQDVRYAARSFARNRGFTTVAVLTLALGIGANTSIFTVVHAVLLKSLPYTNADRLVRLMESVPGAEMPDGRARRIGALAASDVEELQRRTRTLSSVASYTQAGVTLSGREGAIYLNGASTVTSELTSASSGVTRCRSEELARSHTGPISR